VMIEAYLDESGIHDGAKVCVVGGYYGTQAAWRKFEKEWNKIIADYPGLKDRGFHAKDFFRREKGNRVGVYQAWDDEKARKFLDRLVQAIMRNRVFPIGYAVVVKDFLALPLNLRRWFTGGKFTLEGKYVSSGCPDKSYYVPFQFCVLDSARISGADVTNKIHFVAGLDRSFSGYANALFNYLFNDPRLQASIQQRMGGITYPLAKDTPGLQAADLLVYRFYRFVLDKLSAKDNLPEPVLISRLLKNRKKKQRFTLFDSDYLHKMQKMAREHHGKLVQNGGIPQYLSNLRKS